MSKATRNMITAKAAPVGHSSPATWKKPAMVSAKTGPPRGVAKNQLKSEMQVLCKVTRETRPPQVGFLYVVFQVLNIVATTCKVLSSTQSQAPWKSSYT